MLFYLLVSIPFKRETISKAKHLNHFFKPGGHCFNSLQTGTHIQRGNFHRHASNRTRFQFPSNGNAYTKHGIIILVLLRIRVSIPFKRERIYKGKRCMGSNQGHRFQFPSNGNAETKMSIEEFADGLLSSFNSLQTGTHIQSLSHRLLTASYGCSCFNSLQTGTHIQSQN